MAALPPWNGPKRGVGVNRHVKKIGPNRDAGPVCIERGAGPLPQARLGNQARGNRVLVDVIELLPEIAGAPKDKIEITRLPDGARNAASFRDGESRTALPFAHQCGEKVVNGPQEKVNVVGHDHIREKRKGMALAHKRQMFEANVPFVRTERRDVPGEVCCYEEETAGRFNPSEARHARILM
jgi:hypothetical protein